LSGKTARSHVVIKYSACVAALIMSVFPALSQY